MKKIILAVAIMCVPLFGISQNTNEIFDKYNGKEDVTTVSVSKYMFSMFSDVQTGDAESQEFLDLVKTIDGLKILTTTNKDYIKDIINTATLYMNKNGFEELLTINENGKKVIFKIKESGKKVSELNMLVQEDNEVVFMNITGDIDLKKISQLSKKMNISGLEDLKDLDNN